jgi:hypothetical protein
MNTDQIVKDYFALLVETKGILYADLVLNVSKARVCIPSIQDQVRQDCMLEVLSNLVSLICLVNGISVTSVYADALEVFNMRIQNESSIGQLH